MLDNNKHLLHIQIKKASPSFHDDLCIPYSSLFTLHSSLFTIDYSLLRRPFPSSSHHDPRRSLKTHPHSTTDRLFSAVFRPRRRFFPYYFAIAHFAL